MTPVTRLDCAGKLLDLTRPRVMGILNITPDSFSDGGDFFASDAAVERATAMVEEGAAIVDVGGESTRPGAATVSEEEELRRVTPVIEALSQAIDVPISVDTSKPRVMREAVAAGAGLINDIRALRVPGALQAAAEAGVPVCLMHMQGEPGDMQRAPVYGDVVAEVRGFLAARIEACQAAGISRDRLLADPGFGFGKTLAHNLALFRGLNQLTGLGAPILVGVSRKSMIGALLDDAPVDARLHGSVAAAVVALMSGAAIIRAHDVKATVDALAVAHSLKPEN